NYLKMEKEKTDKVLGLEIEKYLISIGKQTPTFEIDRELHSEEDNIEAIEEYFAKIMEVLGLDLNDDSLRDTPRRVSKMFVKEIFWGLNPENFPKCTAVENKMGYDE